MLNDIWKKTNIRYTNRLYPKHQQLQQLINKYIESSINYYSYTGRVVKRPNILVTLLEKLDISTLDDITSTYIKLVDKAEYYANEVGIITTVNKKTDLINSTVINGMDESFLYVNDNFDIYNKEESFLSVRCLYTTISDIFITHPSNFTLTKEEDFTIFSIDVIKLGVSYYYWSLEQEFINASTDPAKFIFEVTNNLAQRSIFDYTLYNIFIRLYHNDTFTFKNDNPFIVRDFTKEITKMYSYTIDVINKNNHLDYYEFLHNIPLISSDTVADIIDLPNTLYNRRNVWITWIARIDTLYTLLDIVDDKLNRDRITKLKKLIKYAHSDKIFDINDTKLDNHLNYYLTMINKLKG